MDCARLRDCTMLFLKEHKHREMLPELPMEAWARVYLIKVMYLYLKNVTYL